MKQISIYKFSELSPEAQAKALLKKRREMEENDHHQMIRWAIDDCALLEPPHREMAALFGEDYYEKNKNGGQYGQFVFKNNRKGLRVDPEDDFIQIAEALEITNDAMFLTWLGFPEALHDSVSYSIEDRHFWTEIYFDTHAEDPNFTAVTDLIPAAQAKFEAHMASILERIRSSVEGFLEEEAPVQLEELGEVFLADGSTL